MASSICVDANDQPPQSSVMDHDLPFDSPPLPRDSSVCACGGTCFTRFIPVRCLGRGAHGRAALCRRASDGMLVVVKQINIEDVSY